MLLLTSSWSKERSAKMKTRLGKISLTILFTLIIVLLAAHMVMRSVVATPVSRADVQTTATAIEVDTNAIQLQLADVLAMAAMSGGNVFYVDSGATGSGTAADWTNADVTIELALVHCAANNGDFIVCAPYHVETASTGTFDLDKDGVTVVGLGKGDAMTTISYDTTTDTCIMGASGDGCTIRNLKFIATVTAVASAIVVEDGCTDFVIEDCIFKNETTTVDEFIDTIYIHGTAANNGIIRRNLFEGDKGANAGPQASIGFEDAHFLEIYDNKFSGDIAVAHIENKTTAANYISIHDNEILCGYIGADSTNLDTTPGITLVATTTGWIQDNFVVTNVATPELAIVAADCYLSGNKYSETQGAASLDIGLEVGKTYVRSSATLVSGATDNIFTIAGGRIEILSLFGECITNIGTVGATDIFVDATAGADYDADFCTAVDIDALAAGDTITFTNAVSEGVLTFVANQGAGQPLSWYCPAGILILDPTTTDTGAITWWMTFRPLEPLVTVTVGP
jgi:hypothetical protein